ncbi:MAG: tetratricopeptide repeat protein [Muribaculaceae bacterium]|nr:tetratricopeptide repeat protein [Muribaculaceae bacterium]
MKSSLDTLFIKVTNSHSLNQLVAFKAGSSIFALRHGLANAPLLIVIDTLRVVTTQMISENNISKALAHLQWLDTMFTRLDNDNVTDVHIAIKLTRVAVLIEDEKVNVAMGIAADALSMLVQNSRRKDEGYMSLLAISLYDLALIHCETKEYKQAEREILKSVKLLERLVKINPERYSTAQLTALNASTSIYRSRVDQANLLATYEVETSTYLAEVNNGIVEATTRLITSLQNVGDTLSQMNRYREAIHFYTRALKYLTRIEGEFTLQQLRLSIALGEALVQTKNTRDKGVHLLNTMLHKATKLEATDEHKQIVEILLNAKNNSLDILGLWHKMFPK